MPSQIEDNREIAVLNIYTNRKNRKEEEGKIQNAKTLKKQKNTKKKKKNEKKKEKKEIGNNRIRILIQIYLKELKS